MEQFPYNKGGEICKVGRAGKGSGYLRSRLIIFSSRYGPPRRSQRKGLIGSECRVSGFLVFRKEVIEGGREDHRGTRRKKGQSSYKEK